MKDSISGRKMASKTNIRKGKDVAIGVGGGERGSGLSAGDTREWRRLLEIFDERINIADVLAQHMLFVRLRPCVLLASTTAVVGTVPPIQRSGKLTRTPLGARDWHLRHEVKVQKFKQLDLDALCSLLILEQGCNRQQAVHVFEYPCVLRRREKSGDEDEEGLRLDRWAVVRVEEVQQEVHVDLATEDDARWRM